MFRICYVIKILLLFWGYHMHEYFQYQFLRNKNTNLEKFSCDLFMSACNIIISTCKISMLTCNLDYSVCQLNYILCLHKQGLCKHNCV